MINEYFCILPWVHFHLDTVTGFVKVCCSAKEFVSQHGIPMSLYQFTLDEISNSDYMRKFRERMARGEKLPECVFCFAREKNFGSSLRTNANKEWFSRLNIDWPFLKEHGRSTNYASYKPFSNLRVDMGDECNLMCRMCSGGRNDRIKKDYVSNLWSPDFLGNSYGRQKDRLIFSRFPDIKPLQQQDKFLFDELFANTDSIQRIHFTGGEPLIIGRVKDVLNFLIAKGAAGHIHITFNTNFTVVPDELVRLLANFRKVSMYISIDGTEKVYEYIRYPATWQVVNENIQRIKNYEHIEITATPLVQVYNLLDIVDLCVFFDNMGINYVFNVLRGPKFLQIGLIPPHALTIASERLRKYTDTLAPSHEKSRNQVLSLAAQIDECTDERNEEMLLKFMKFTNDLDISRGQSIRESLPELFQAIKDSGFIWKME